MSCAPWTTRWPCGTGWVRGVEVEADEVLVAIGSLPNTEWLEGSGLTLSDGLLCDEYSAAAPGVYRTGDRLTGVLTIGRSPKVIRPWRQSIAAGATWREAVETTTRVAMTNHAAAGH